MSKTLYSGQYFSIMQPDNGDDYILSGNEAIVVPIDATGQVYLIKEPSSAFGEQCLLLPGGSVDDGETPSVTANRELQEEIGYAANTLSYLGEIWPFSKYLTVRTFVYAGRDLVPSSMTGDEDHEIEKHLYAGDDLQKLIQSGQINDARVIAALFMSGVVTPPSPM